MIGSGCAGVYITTFCQYALNPAQHQIPGNDNSVQQSLLINLAVIQAPSTDAEAVRDAVAGFFLAGP